MRDVASSGDGSAELFLRRLVAGNGGSISVERFMQEALQHPQLGYYARRVSKIGQQGDFSTAATLHPALGRAIGAWAKAHRFEVARRGEWHLIELGAGTGQMAAEVLHALGWSGRAGLKYHVVETSSGLRDAQRRELRRHERRVRWHEDIKLALAEAGGRALIFSNEFVDAFPCVQLAREPSSGRWQEVRLRFDDGSGELRETFVDWHGPPPTEGGDAGFAPRQRIEKHFSYQRWLETWSGQWSGGRMLTVDYGDEAEELHRRHTSGSLRGYCRHLRVTGQEVFRRFGQQDLTADVNFTDLRQWGEACGFQTLSTQTQGDFLRRWLPRKMLVSAQKDPALDFLLDADGAGGAYKVLEQRQNAA